MHVSFLKVICFAVRSHSEKAQCSKVPSRCRGAWLRVSLPGDLGAVTFWPGSLGPRRQLPWLCSVQLKAQGELNEADGLRAALLAHCNL